MFWIPPICWTEPDLKVCREGVEEKVWKIHLSSLLLFCWFSHLSVSFFPQLSFLLFISRFFFFSLSLCILSCLFTRDVHRNFEGQLLCPGKKGQRVNFCHRRCHAPVPWTHILPISDRKSTRLYSSHTLL